MLFKRVVPLLCCIILLAFLSCQNAKDGKVQNGMMTDMDSSASCSPRSRANQLAARTLERQSIILSNGARVTNETDTANWPEKPWPSQMVWIPAGNFRMGGIGKDARPDEFPLHDVSVDGFWMDQTEVTNEAFKKFVQEKKFITTAEVKPDWEELKKQLPPGTPKPDEALLVPGSLVFTPTSGPVDLSDFSQWWRWEPGANWKHPNGGKESIQNTTQLDQHPVVQVSWFDAVSFAGSQGKRLPTEAEWEYAARGGKDGNIYGWGNDEPNTNNIKANIWQGQFPFKNSQEDGFVFTAPVGFYKPNAYGLYDMMGNVWEWCNDWYRPSTYAEAAKNNSTINPKGPPSSYDPEEPFTPKKVVRGGSFLCNKVYCASYRPSARMKTSPDSGESHTGFRCVMSDADWRKVREKHL